jgi:GNAT superfamily N-acetyltransferase
VTPVVREAVAEDLPAVLPLYRELYEEFELRLDDRVRRAWAETLSTTGRTVLLAEDDGVPVGTVDLTVLVNAARGGQPYLLVENVVVATSHRRRGIARTLFAEAERRGRAAGCYKLVVSAEDPEACAFYESVGLEPRARTFKRYLD